jgi:hypothetical protein
MKESRLMPLLQRTDVRLALFGLAAVVSVYLGFFAISPATAGTLIGRGGFYAMLAVFLLFLASLWRLWRDPAERLQIPRREPFIAAAVILLFSIVAITNETFRSKILYDEYVLQSTAYNMHFFREVSAMVRGYDVLGTFIASDSYLDKRPYFYPFLITLVHDFTGYRAGNAYLLNAGLLPTALGVAYLVGRSIAQWRGGILAVALLGALPVFGQNATGSGMELINVTMLLTSIALGTAYLARPNIPRLSAFILAVSCSRNAATSRRSMFCPLRWWCSRDGGGRGRSRFPGLPFARRCFLFPRHCTTRCSRIRPCFGR